MGEDEIGHLAQILLNSVQKRSPQTSEEIHYPSNELKGTSEPPKILDQTKQAAMEHPKSSISGRRLDRGKHSTILELTPKPEVDVENTDKADDDCIDEGDGVDLFDNDPIVSLPKIDREAASLGGFDEFPTAAKEHRNKEIDISERTGDIGGSIRKRRCKRLPINNGFRALITPKKNKGFRKIEKFRRIENPFILRKKRILRRILPKSKQYLLVKIPGAV